MRIGYLVSHPIQYQAPLLRHLVAHGGLDLTALFLSDFSLRTYVDPGFGVAVRWDVPLLEGYKSRFVPRFHGGGEVSLLNPLHGDLRHLLAGRIDVLWLHGYAQLANLRALAAARSLGIPVLLRCESNLASHPRGRFRKLVKEGVLRALFARIDGFLAIGSANADYYRHYGVPDERIHLVPYAVDNAFFRARAALAAPGREAFRAALGLKPGVPVILFASKFQGRKRAGDLWRAYRALATDHGGPNAYLLFIGDGDGRAAIEAEARASGWDTVRFLGFRNQTELPAFYDLCDVFVLPSEFEPWGLVVNEVMNCRRPVIAGDQVGSAPDLVRHGETGWVFRTGDVPALSACLREAVADPARTRAMGEAAYRRVGGWDFAADLAGLRQALAAVLPGGPP